METIVERGRTVLLSELPPGSIAVDGYVQGPGLDLEGRRFSFDHHGGCVRLVTRASCAQVMDALLLGLDPSDMKVFVNDVDGDTVLCVWLLRNPARAADPAVRAMVEAVAGVDAHGPAYPLLEPDLAAAFVAGPMAAEQAARRDGSYSTCDLEAMLEGCVAALDAWVEAGMPRDLEGEAPGTYEVTHRGVGGWVMARTEGYAFPALYADGHTRILTHKVLPDGSWQYTVARKSDLVSGFPVGPPDEPGSILGALAAREPGWGGGSSIGGSPRRADGGSSELSPDQVFELVDALLRGEGAA